MTQLRNVPTMVFADVTNIYFAVAKQFSRKLNYESITKKLLDENSDMRTMNAYAAFRKHYGPFISLLSNLGYNVKHKTIDSFLPHVTFSCQITLDVLEQGDIKKFIFITNDYGLIPLYDYLTKHDRYVEVWSPIIPPAIQQAASDYFEFGDNYCANAIPKTAKT